MSYHITLLFVQKTLFTEQKVKPDYENVPCAVFRYNTVYTISNALVIFTA